MLINKMVKIYPIAIVKKYRLLILSLCILYVILKLFYSVIPRPFEVLLNDSDSEIRTVNSVINMTEKQIVNKNSVSTGNEKRTVTNSNNSNVSKKQIVNIDNIVSEKQKITNSSFLSVYNNQTARSITVVSNQKDKTSRLKVDSITEEPTTKIMNTESVTIGKLSDKLPPKINVPQKQKAKKPVNKKPVGKPKKKIPDMSCHYSSLNDTLPSVEDPSFSPGDHPIFFHETSCRGGINNRQACAIESAARLHPKRQINLLFSASINENNLKNSNLAHLLKIKNIKMFRLHVEQYAEGTVVESLFKTKIKKSLYPIEHIADILRIVTLNKYGGVYLDTDSFLVKNLDLLPPNWIAEESNDTLSSGAMGFSIDDFGHNLTTAILKEINNTYQPTSWSNNGPKAIQRVLRRVCPKTIKTSGDCKGLKIFPPKDFYPVHYSQNIMYFKKGKMDLIYQPYMHHMWNHLTMNKKIEKDSPYANLAKELCPTIFRAYGKEFGQ